MKVLTYQFNGILKTVGYSQENEEIAKKEAENGDYMIREAEEQPAVLTLEERIVFLENQISVPDYTTGTWYYRGDKVTFEGAVFTCIAPAGVVCVWSPAEYTSYWQK